MICARERRAAVLWSLLNVTVGWVGRWIIIFDVMVYDVGFEIFVRDSILLIERETLLASHGTSLLYDVCTIWKFCASCEVSFVLCFVGWIYLGMYGWMDRWMDGSLGVWIERIQSLYQGSEIVRMGN